MTDQPDRNSFEVRNEGVAAVARSFTDADVHSLENAFPAALLAPTWRALIEGGAIQAPPGVEIERVGVRLLSPTKLELSVPVTLQGREEVVKTLTVFVDRWTASGEIDNQLGGEATILAAALEVAHGQRVFDHDGAGQKPHN